MSESSEIIRNEFSMCENPLDVLKCQTCPEKVIENEVSVPTVVVIRVVPSTNARNVNSCAL